MFQAGGRCSRTCVNSAPGECVEPRAGGRGAVPTTDSQQIRLMQP